MEIMYTGVVTTYIQAKAWGFITVEMEADYGEKYSEKFFFHLANCRAGYSPQLGDPVKFKSAPPISLGKKDQAVDVHLVEGSATPKVGV